MRRSDDQEIRDVKCRQAALLRDAPCEELVEELDHHDVETDAVADRQTRLSLLHSLRRAF